MPRRRLTALICALAVAGLAIGVTAGLATRHRTQPRLVPQDRPGPVLLVPGYGGATGSLSVLATRLAAAGRDAQVVPLAGNGTGDLRVQARVLDAAARAALARTGAHSVDVIGYSAGGVIARLWVRSYGGAAIARRVLTMGSPHHGTRGAGFAALLAPGSCPVACQQLAPGSDLLVALNRGDETPAGPQWVSVWSRDDEVVLPTDSPRLRGAVDIVVQDVCPGVRVTHGQLPADPLVQGIVVAELAADPVFTPRATDCARLH